MTVDDPTGTWDFVTADGKRLHVVCPICASKTFRSLGPPSEKDRAGFQHVIMGKTGDGKLLSLPVRSKHCSNCGYILRFLIANQEMKGT